MARTLAQTTPHMTGADVKALQKALRDSKYGDFMNGADVDGDFGTETGQAVYRAKYWLGYKTPDKKAGPLLVPYLTGKTALTPDMAKRRAARKAKQAATPLRLKALAEMKKMLGMKERPAGSNRCEVTSWYGLVGPWCAMGVSMAYVMAGSAAFKRGSRYASCGVIGNDALAGRNNLSVTRNPQPGDLLLLKWPGLSGYRWDHIGMVEQARPLKTIECNTSPDSGGSQANGGMCCRKNREDERRAGIVKLYIHVSK